MSTDYEAMESEFDRRFRLLTANKLNVDASEIERVEELWEAITFSCETCEYTTVELEVELKDGTIKVFQFDFTGGLYDLLKYDLSEDGDLYGVEVLDGK